MKIAGRETETENDAIIQEQHHLATSLLQNVPSADILKQLSEKKWNAFCVEKKIHEIRWQISM